jgi:predicted HTH domain antitoxin
MNVDVSFPEELLVASMEDRKTFSRKVTIYTLGHLYEQGKISSGIGAKVLGCSRIEFYRLLSEHGFPVIDHDEEELQDEAQSSRELARRKKHS